MGSKTVNYQLNQWEANDSFLRTDFNEDNAKIDAALGGLAQQVSQSGVVTGSYTGNGASSRNFDLGFRPKAVYVCTQGGIAGTLEGSEYCYGGLALDGSPVMRSSAVALTVTETGFTISTSDSSYIRINQNATVYHYFAIR